MSQSKARTVVQGAVKDFYYKHHDPIKMEDELVNEINGERVVGFTEAKRRFADAISFRIDKYVAESCVENGYNSRMIDELEKLRLLVKGMVVKTDG